MTELITPEILKKLLEYPILIGVFYILFTIQRNNARLVEVIEKLIEKVTK